MNIRKTAVLLISVLLLFSGCGSAGREWQQTRSAENEVASAKDKLSSAEREAVPGESRLQVHYMDVGQGDAVLIACDGEFMLIDAGKNDQGTAIQLYLQSQKTDALKYVIGTHPDADHIGGMDVVITKFDCGTVFLPEEEKDTITYRDVIDAMKYKGYKKTVPSVGDTYTLGGAEFTIIGPPENAEDSNDNSIALILTHGENRFYFEGDASEKEEAAILAAGIEMDADVYMAGHHGSKTSSSDDVLDAVNPEFAVISVGEGNSYGHPHAEILNKLRSRGVQVYRTDEQGTIVAESDGKTIAFNCTPSDSWQTGEASGGSETVMVHVTKSGKKYHSAGCSYLEDSDLEISLSDAKAQGYTPCAKCNPPQ